MKFPLISVIVPVYNVEKYLDRCVESIVSQTYKNLEIILVDDGSPDNCPEMCDAWAEKDSRIKVIHKENGGVSSARNAALDIAGGEYIGFVDSDDYIESNMFEVLLKNLIDNNADISVCGYQINDENDGEFNVRTVSQSDALKLVCIGDYKYGVLWNKLYKKSILKNIKMLNFVCCEDLIFNYYAIKKAGSIVECDSKLYHYFQNANSTVHNNFSIGAFDAVFSKEIILENQKGTEFEDYAIKGLISSCFVVLSGCIQNDTFPKETQNLIDEILKYRKDILFSGMYSKLDKFKTVILSISPKLYKYLIRRKNR